MIDLKDIKNPINRMATALSRAGMDKTYISQVVAHMVEDREQNSPTRYCESPYHCTCNNWGPRFIEDSLDGCCPGCFQWALDHHYEVPTSKLDPNRVTREMIENNTWGINVAQLDKNRANRLIDKALAEDFNELPDVRELNHKKHAFDWLAAGNDPEDGAGIPRDPDVPSFFHNLDWLPEDV